MTRYSRQEIYIGKSNQKKLLNSTVAIVGIGAIGTQTSQLLARAGINLILIDRDTIELNNLQRQTLFNEQDTNKPKSKQAHNHLKNINSNIKITSHNKDLNNKNISKLIPKNTSLILDCTDNLETRFLINDFSLKNNIPWIYSAGIKEKASLMNIIPKKTPCFQCIFKPAQLETCQTAGVLNSTTSLIASLQVSEAIKILLNKHYSKELININLKTNSFDKFKVRKRKDCQACNKHYLFLNTINPQGILKFCSTGNYQMLLKDINLQKLKKDLSKISKIEDLGECIKFRNMLIFKDRCLIKANTEREAKSLISQYIGN